MGYYLGVVNGEVRGMPKETADEDGEVFNLIPVGLRIVCIQHQDTSQYVAINKEGKVYVTVSLILLIQVLLIFLNLIHIMSNTFSVL